MAGASVSVPSEKLAFYFSGLRNTDGSAFTVNPDPENLEISNSLIKVDMSSPGEATWTEIPLPASSVDEPAMGRADGQLVWIPVGEQGILLAIGGVIYPQDRYGFYLDSDQTSESQQRSPGFMTNILVYDIATNEFYSQPTAGDVHPGQLSKSCTVVGGAPGDSSFEVYMYGGDNGLSGNDASNAHDEVWVLSVPSFTWTQVKEATPGHGRSGHICSAPFPNQMLVVGGWNYDEDGFCIPDGSVIDLFNLNTLEWTHEYDPSSYENYTTPAAIRTTPRATLEPGVEALFAIPYSTHIQPWYPYEEDSPDSSTPIEAIVGGVVGGAAVVIILFLIWYFRIRKRKNQDQSESGTSHTRVHRWRRGVQRPSADLPYLPKDLASDTTTEVDPQMSPPAEAYGDYYFRERNYASPTTNQNSTPVDGNMTPGHSPRRVSYQCGQTPRSPHSLQPGSFEADGEEVHEKDGNVRVSQLSDLGQAPVDFRQHPAYPYSIDRVASSDQNSVSPAHRNPLGSDISHVSGRTRQHSNTVPSPVIAGASIQEVDNGDANANEKGTDTIASGIITASRPIRPTHQRRGSSMSSNFPITPPADHDPDRSRPPLEMRMSATSGPISPLLGVNEHPERPAHHRNNSSMSSGLSGNVTLPPLLNPMSPSSVYSPVPTSEAVETDPRNLLEKSKEQEDEEQEEEERAMSAEPTLIGAGPSPMTEKVNPLGLGIATMAQTLDTRTPTSGTNTNTAAATGAGNGNTSPTSPRRKPVGGFNQS